MPCRVRAPLEMEEKQVWNYEETRHSTKPTRSDNLFGDFGKTAGHKAKVLVCTSGKPTNIKSVITSHDIVHVGSIRLEKITAK